MILIIETVTKCKQTFVSFPGFCTAANDSGTEWLIVMGIEDFVNDIQSSINNWKEVASVMAASVVAKIFSDTKIFQDWPHSYAGITSFFSLYRESSNLLFSCGIFLYVLQIKVAFSYL